MDTKTIMRIKPELTRFLHQFDDCFGRITTRRYLDLYVEGQLSDLPRKSIEPMADAFGDRTKWVTLTLQNIPYKRDKDYRLVLRDIETDIVVQSVNVKIDRAFGEDF